MSHNFSAASLSTFARWATNGPGFPKRLEQGYTLIKAGNCTGETLLVIIPAEVHATASAYLTELLKV